MSQTLLTPALYGNATAAGGLSDCFTENVFVPSPELGTLATGDTQAWLSVTERRLKGVGRLVNNWDGRGSSRVPESVLAFAWNTLQSIMPSSAPAPAVIPLGQGGIQLIWYSPRGELEVEIAKPNSVFIFHLDHVNETEREWPESTDFRRLADILWKMFRE